MNREGYIVVNFDKGGLSLYGINGKTFPGMLPLKQQKKVFFG